jgi:hypothetical protein
VLCCDDSAQCFLHVQFEAGFILPRSLFLIASEPQHNYFSVTLGIWVSNCNDYYDSQISEGHTSSSSSVAMCLFVVYCVMIVVIVVCKCTSIYPGIVMYLYRLLHVLRPSSRRPTSHHIHGNRWWSLLFFLPTFLSAITLCFSIGLTYRPPRCCHIIMLTQHPYLLYHALLLLSPNADQHLSLALFSHSAGLQCLPCGMEMLL